MNHVKPTHLQSLVLTEVSCAPINLTLSEVGTRIAKRTSYTRFQSERAALELVEQGRLVEHGPYLLSPNN
jgi:hypothetical protein